MTLMEFLLKNSENRGVLAMLRQSLIPAKEMRAWPILSRFGGIGRSSGARAVRTVAALFAHHPQNSDTGNMGNTCRALCVSDEHPWEAVDGTGRAVPPGPMSRKFIRLLESDAEEICERTARIVLYAKSRRIPVNYAQLEADLAGWPRAREAWARAFWAEPRPESQKEEPAA